MPERGMRAALERHLMARWYGGVPPGMALRGIALTYGTMMRLRRALYRVGLLRQHRLRQPVVVVGNRTVGGAGKTPLVIALVEALRERGWRPGVLSRGYGRTGRGLALVRPDSAPSEVGDEPLLVHLATGAPVAVDADRVAAARALIDAGCDVLIADDGLQHLRLGRTVEVEVQDARGLGNARVMPAGPLREPLPARAADVRVVHGREAVGDETPMRLALGDARRVGRTSHRDPADESTPRARRPLSAFSGQRVHAVAGIGHPARFFTALREIGLDPIEHPFPDHHDFVAADFATGAFASLPDAPILMTGKDAVKCRGLGLADAWEVPVQAVLPQATLDSLDHRLRTSNAHVDP